MADDNDDPADAAARLEAALDRIAGRAHRPPKASEAAAPAPVTPEIATRVDALIERVRAALGAG